MSVKLEHLRAFVAVVDAGSFTDAATELHVSQAAVSRGVAALEVSVGGRVLERSTRRVRPTALGDRVLPAARRALDAVRDVERIAGADRRELRVGYAWSALGRHTVEVQRRWADADPSRRIVFVQENSPSGGLDEGAVDVAVVRHPVDPARFDSAVVGTERRYAVLAADHPLTGRRGVRLVDFAGETVAVDDRTGTTTRDLWDPLGVEVRFQPIRGVDDLLTLVAGGQAVGITPAATVAQHRRAGVVYRPVLDAEPVPVRIAWRRDRPGGRPDALIRLVSEVYAGG